MRNIVGEKEGELERTRDTKKHVWNWAKNFRFNHRLINSQTRYIRSGVGRQLLLLIVLASFRKLLLCTLVSGVFFLRRLNTQKLGWLQCWPTFDSRLLILIQLFGNLIRNHIFIVYYNLHSYTIRQIFFILDIQTILSNFLLSSYCLSIITLDMVNWMDMPPSNKNQNVILIHVALLVDEVCTVYVSVYDKWWKGPTYIINK